MIWAILAAGSTGVLIALLGFRMPMLIATAVAGLVVLPVIGLLGGHGLLLAVGQAIAGIIALQLSYVVSAFVIVSTSDGRTMQGSTSGPSRRLLSFFRR